MNAQKDINNEVRYRLLDRLVYHDYPVAHNKKGVSHGMMDPRVLTDCVISTGLTAIHLAVQERDDSALKILLMHLNTHKARAAVNAPASRDTGPTHEDDTPLFLSCSQQRSDSYAVTRLHLVHGTDPSCRCYHGECRASMSLDYKPR